ncbi:MAG TPA: energy transducer TonB [Terriglobales bacterium]|nr:energy transducer TonB [Terriglobales bacterium]
MANPSFIPRSNNYYDRLLEEANQSALRSLVNNLRDALFPQKLPPLQLTSKPIPVRSIWGDYNFTRQAAAGSLALHLLFVGGMVGATILGARMVKQVVQQQSVSLISPDDISPYVPLSNKKNDTIGGGGGGGDRDKLAASFGKLPKRAMEQFTPPAVVIRNMNPRLPMEPTVVVPPQVKVPMPNVPQLGDPLSKVMGPPSNGTGSGGGIGSGEGGGVGSGIGPGVGPGRGGGIGGGIFRVGGGVSAPRIVYSPDPEYSEEARKAKYQGTCVLYVVVDAAGHPRDIRVARSLGMGLDEKALEAVRTWRFEPAMKDGKPVAVAINVEVNFHLY